LAARGGGKYYSESNADNIREDLDLSSKQEQISKSYELWYQFSIFLIIIFLFSLEWFLRKRSGLA